MERILPIFSKTIYKPALKHLMVIENSSILLQYYNDRGRDINDEACGLYFLRSEKGKVLGFFSFKKPSRKITNREMEILGGESDNVVEMSLHLSEEAIDKKIGTEICKTEIKRRFTEIEPPIKAALFTWRPANTRAKHLLINKNNIIYTGVKSFGEDGKFELGILDRKTYLAQNKETAAEPEETNPVADVRKYLLLRNPSSIDY